jgi:hypothetical protein
MTFPYISRVDAGTIELVRSFRGRTGKQRGTGAAIRGRVFSCSASDARTSFRQNAPHHSGRVAEIARRIRADEPTTEWDIAQFMLGRYKEEGMQQEPMIVAVNANTADPHYMPTKEKNSPIKRGDFVLIDAATKLNKPDAVATDQTWDWLRGRNRSGRIHPHFQHCAGSARFCRRFCPQKHSRR